jgi:hypothetical protein
MNKIQKLKEQNEFLKSMIRSLQQARRGKTKPFKFSTITTKAE